MISPEEYRFIVLCAQKIHLPLLTEEEWQRNLNHPKPSARPKPRTTVMLIEGQLKENAWRPNYSPSIDARVYVKNMFYAICYWRDSVAVRNILTSSVETKVDICKMFSKILGDCFQYSTHKCLVYSPMNFILINDFGGGTGKYTSDTCEMYLFMAITICRQVSFWQKIEELGNQNRLKELSHNPLNFRSLPLDPTSCFRGKARVIERYLHKLYRDLINEGNLSCPLNFRPFQTLCLYMASQSNSYDSCDFKNALQVAWCSVPDTLLTMTEFTRSFERLDERCMSTIFEAWDWYCTLVRDVESPEKCPRSLKHLSRCAIRNRLKDYLRLPDGVCALDIPASLKEYLLLKDFSRCN